MSTSHGRSADGSYLQPQVNTFTKAVNVIMFVAIPLYKPDEYLRHQRKIWLAEIFH